MCVLAARKSLWINSDYGPLAVEAKWGSGLWEAAELRAAYSDLCLNHD